MPPKKKMHPAAYKSYIADKEFAHQNIKNQAPIPHEKAKSYYNDAYQELLDSWDYVIDNALMPSLVERARYEKARIMDIKEYHRKGIERGTMTEHTAQDDLDYYQTMASEDMEYWRQAGQIP